MTFLSLPRRFLVQPPIIDRGFQIDVPGKSNANVRGLPITLHGEPSSPCEQRRRFPSDVAKAHSYAPGCGEQQTHHELIQTAKSQSVGRGEDRLSVFIMQFDPQDLCSSRHQTQPPHTKRGGTKAGSVVSIAHLGSDVVDAEQTLAERGLVDAFVAGGEVSNRPKLDLSRFILPPREA